MPVSRQRLFLLVAVLYFVSGLVRAPAEPRSLRDLPAIDLGWVALSTPQVLSGDSPHYLVAVSSLIEDFDLDLSNNYAQAEAGDWDAGSRLRGVKLDHHTEEDASGAELPTHSPFFAGLLALMVWPFRNTSWVEPICIWLTTLVSLAGLMLFHRGRQQTSRAVSNVLILALATPLWCYSRDLWSEPWVMTVWLGLIVLPGPWTAFFLSVVGTLIKYPFGVVPLAMGFWSYRRGERSRGIGLLAGGLCGLAIAVAVTQLLFRQADHFSFFHSGIHAPFDWPLDGAVGLLFGPQNGLLLFFPVLLWTWPKSTPERSALAAAVLFFLVHASYSDWQGGTGFSARYMVPLLPILVSGVIRAPGRWSFRLALAWSLLWGAVAGIVPALVYDRSPWGALSYLLSRIGFW